MAKVRPEITAARKAGFVAALAESGIIAKASAASGVPRKTVYEWRSLDPAFALACDEAMQQAADNLESEARRRAIEGTDEPVFYQGEQIGTVRKYSDRLLELLLKAKKPEFRESSKVELHGNLQLGELTTDQIKAELAALAAKGLVPPPADAGPVTKH